jgi:hypothetical protein
MTKRVEELKIKGSEVVAYIEGDTTKPWSSNMVVVGTMKDAPTEKDHEAKVCIGLERLRSTISFRYSPPLSQSPLSKKGPESL